MADLSGVAAVVTGAGRGLGRGIALGLARRGAGVAVLDVDEVSATTVLREIEKAGGSGLAVPVDVTKEESVDAAVEACLGGLGGIDLLVNNAGVLSVSEVVHLPLSEWHRVMNVNATGVFLMSRAVARVMIAQERRPASIVSIASIAGKRGDPKLAHYSASKFAVIGFTQALAKELAPFDITVNAICPGLLETTMIEELARGWATSVQDMVEVQAIKRAQDPEDIAAGVAFLHRNRSMTGQAINIDGGTLFH